MKTGIAMQSLGHFRVGKRCRVSLQKTEYFGEVRPDFPSRSVTYEHEGEIHLVAILFSVSGIPVTYQHGMDAQIYVDRITTRADTTKDKRIKIRVYGRFDKYIVDRSVGYDPFKDRGVEVTKCGDVLDITTFDIAKQSVMWNYRDGEVVSGTLVTRLSDGLAVHFIQERIESYDVWYDRQCTSLQSVSPEARSVVMKARVKSLDLRPDNLIHSPEYFSSFRTFDVRCGLEIEGQYAMQEFLRFKIHHKTFVNRSTGTLKEMA